MTTQTFFDDFEENHWAAGDDCIGELPALPPTSDYMV